MKAALNLLFGLLFLLWAIPVSAGVLWSCDFESNGRMCILNKDGNRIATFSQLGIPALKGGGNYAITAKNGKSVNSEDLDLYYRSHATQNLYARVYVYFPNGWRAGGNFANGLKFLGALSHQSTSKCSECVWTPIWWKAAEQEGQIWIAPQHQKEPTLTQGGRVNKPLTRGKWHYVELHMKNNPNDRDVLEAWIDSDSRSSSPTYRFVWELFPATSDKFGTVDMNINWSGMTPSWVQEYYVDGLATGNSPIGDTYGLIGNQGGNNNQADLPPNVPSAVTVQ